MARIFEIFILWASAMITSVVVCSAVDSFINWQFLPFWEWGQGGRAISVVLGIGCLWLAMSIAEE